MPRRNAIGSLQKTNAGMQSIAQFCCCKRRGSDNFADEFWETVEF
jgi:hypothetical protein